MNRKSDNPFFLSGGGEMSEVIREKDWSDSSLGLPQDWPQTLQIALSIILKSQFPTFLFWGDEFICFYNNAYRKLLGKDGKHPGLLGMRGEDGWPETWPEIKSFIDSARAGETVWRQDEPRKLFRNARTETGYWTFSYSSISGESGQVNGVLVTVIETTEKIVSNQELRESKNQLEFAIEAASLGTWDYNPMTNEFSSNNRLKEWFGLPSGEQIELTHAVNAIHPRDRDKVTAAIAKALDPSSGGKYDIEYTIVHPTTKKETIVRAMGKAWFNEEMISYRFNGTLEDVTERATAENEIRESEQRYYNLINSSPFAIGILKGESLVITTANQAIIDIWGKGWDIVGKSYFVALPELADQGYREVFAGVFTTGKPFNAVETPVNILQDGKMQLKYYNFLLYAQKNFKGETEGVGIIATEVTSQALFNQQIKVSEKRFRLLADSMPQHIWTSDANGNLNYFNKSVFDYSGLSLEEIHAKGWLQIVHPDDRQENVKVWTDAVNMGKDFLLEHRFRKYTGEYRWQLSRAVAQRDEHGLIQSWVGTSTDIQDQKNFATELERQVVERTGELADKNAELQLINKELESFAYISSHDLQEPLRKIQTFASQLLETEVDRLSENGKDRLLRMQNAAKRMQNLIQDLLLYSRTKRRTRLLKRQI